MAYDLVLSQHTSTNTVKLSLDTKMSNGVIASLPLLTVARADWDGVRAAYLTPERPAEPLYLHMRPVPDSQRHPKMAPAWALALGPEGPMPNTPTTPISQAGVIALLTSGFRVWVHATPAPAPIHA